MQISAREACVKPHLRTRSEINKNKNLIKFLFKNVFKYGVKDVRLYKNNLREIIHIKVVTNIDEQTQNTRKLYLPCLQGTVYRNLTK